MRLLITVLFAASIASAQSGWPTQSTHEIAVPISKLGQPDRHEILKRLQIVASQLRAEVIEQPAGKTFFVQAYGSDLCGTVGNCSFWVFDSDYRVLLKTVAQTASYLPTSHHGRNDILTAQHESAYEQTEMQWHYDGSRYRQISCADINYMPVADHLLKHPHISKIPCE